MLLAQPQAQQEQNTRWKEWTKKSLYCVFILAVFMVVVLSVLKITNVIKPINLEKTIK